MTTILNDIEKKLKAFSVSEDIAKQFLDSVISIMLEYYGLVTTDDGGVIFTYTPSGSQVDYQKVIVKDYNKILKFLNLTLPISDEYGFVNALDLFNIIRKSDKFTKHIYTISELKNVMPDGSIGKKLIVYFMTYIKGINDFMYKYPLEDCLTTALLDYNFPDANIYKFITSAKIEAARLKEKHAIQENISILDINTVKKWIPALKDRADSFVADVINKFSLHIKMLYKLKFTDYVNRFNTKEIRDDLISFFISEYKPV